MGGKAFAQPLGQLPQTFDRAAALQRGEQHLPETFLLEMAEPEPANIGMPAVCSPARSTMGEECARLTHGVVCIVGQRQFTLSRSSASTLAPFAQSPPRHRL